MNEGVFIPGRYLPTGDGYLSVSSAIAWALPITRAPNPPLPVCKVRKKWPSPINQGTDCA